VERTVDTLQYQCRNCEKLPHFPKYSCKTCCCRYTSNYKLAKEKDPRYLRKKEKKDRLDKSDQRLRMLYHRIKEKYFDGDYLPDPNHVSFQWKRGHRGGGVCWKGLKLIKIGKLYGYSFIRKTESTNQMAVTDNFNDRCRDDLVKLMIHEAVHLRLSHHRKSFKQKVAETVAKVKSEDMPELYAGLMKEEV